MPLYPYRCTQCGHRFEKIQKFDDEPEKVCPKCGGALERLLTAPGLQFKGAGWYVNDYAAKSSSSNEAASGESKSGEAKTESKTKSESSGEKSAAPASTSETKSTPSTTPSTKTD